MTKILFPIHGFSGSIFKVVISCYGNYCKVIFGKSIVANLG